MASLSLMHETATSKANGYAGVRTDTSAVSVAVGAAAASRGHDGRIVVTVEYYRPEAFDDDDLSAGGYLLKARSGHTRVAKQIVVDSIQEAVPAVLKFSVLGWMEA